MEFLRRKVYYQLKKHLSLPEIALILGPRQAGKTTLMNKLSQELTAKGVANTYFNLDIIEDRQYFVSQHTLVDQIEKRVGAKYAVVFIDEIQRLPNAGLFLKGLYDMRRNYKFVVSGSGSLDLKADIIEPMTGRKKIFYCLPLSFTEFISHKLKVDFKKAGESLANNPYEKERLINEYLAFGGYPRVVLAVTVEEKREILAEIYKSYLEKDIQLILKVEKEEAFQRLVKILAAQTGNLINRAELALSCGLNEKTVEKYLYLLEKTFVIFLVKPYFSNVRKELRKSPKVYFLDLGFLGLGRGREETGLVPGGVFENACFLRLLEKDLREPVRFWRSASGAEVDFVITTNKGELIPMEVKLTAGKAKTLGKSLVNFLKKYRPKTAFIYNRDKEMKVKKLTTQVNYLPYYRLPEF